MESSLEAGKFKIERSDQAGCDHHPYSCVFYMTEYSGKCLQSIYPEKHFFYKNLQKSIQNFTKFYKILQNFVKFCKKMFFLDNSIVNNSRDNLFRRKHKNKDGDHNPLGPNPQF